MNDAARVNRAIARMACVCVPMTWAVGPGWYEVGRWPIILAMSQSLSLVVIHVIFRTKVRSARSEKTSVLTLARRE